MKKLLLGLTAACCVCMASCASVTVTSNEQALIGAQYQNVVAFNSAVQNDAAVPQYVKDWTAEEVKSWELFNKWANGLPTQ